MKPIIVSASLALLLSPAVFGQDAEPKPSFEVASVKVAEPPKPDAQGRMFIMRGCSGGPLPRSNDPGRFTCTNTTLKSLLTTAYGLKGYQIEGPDWMDTDGYDITAKVPQGTTREQFNLMLQGLLAERFKVGVHHETKSMQVYVLSVAKGGPKLKELTAEQIETAKAAAAAAAAAAPTAPAGRGPMPGMPPMPPPPPGASMQTFSIGGDGRGGGMPGGRGPQPKTLSPRTGMMVNNGNMQRTVSGYLTMTQLVTALSQALDRPVTDTTELKGVYDIDLTWVPTGTDASMGGGPMRMAQSMAVTMGGGDGGGHAPEASDPGGYNLPQSLQAALGLKLDQKKAPGDVLIVDHAEKMPTEN